jgi:hypothetical protein
MATYLPPSENLPIFDTSVFDETNGAYLTYTSAKKLFLTYPTAQGEETIASLIAGSIDYTSPASGSYFEIGTNQVSGGTIRLGPTGTSTGVSVHAGNIDCTNNTINNASASDTGNLALGNSQTSGVLNIGTGVRATTGNGGAINIGGGVGSAAPINIGPISAVSGTGIVNINTSTATTGVINIGSSSATTNIKGTSTCTGTITATSGLSSSGLITTSGNITTTGSGTITSAGTITATSGLSSSGLITTSGNITTTSTGTITSAGTITASSGLSSSGLITTSGNITTTSTGTMTSAGLFTSSTGTKTPYIEPITASSALAIGATQTGAILSIGTGTRTSAINIGNAAVNANTGGVNVGSRGASGGGGGPLTLYGTTINIECANVTTAPMTLTTYVNNDITLAAAGDINLNSTNAGNVYLGVSGSTSVSIGSSTIPTTIYGKITYGGLVQSGNTDIFDTYPTAGVYTVPTSINREFFVVANLNCTGVLFPTGVVGQIINVKNQSPGNITLTAPATYTFYPAGSATGSAPYVMASGVSQRFYYYVGSSSNNILMGF